MTPWRILYTEPLSGAENMALDMALIDRAKATGEYTFRVYSWARPTLSLGRNQTAKGRYKVGAVDIVRRPTGGRALLHHREVTYSVTGPSDGSLRSVYDRVNRILLTGLRGLGVPVQLAAPADRAPKPTDAPCFETPVGGELVVDGKKLVGSAQWRDESAFLQHGSILIDNDQGLIAGLMVEAPGEFPAPATLSEILGSAPPLDTVAESLFDAVKSIEYPGAQSISGVNAGGWLKQFTSDEWTWRR